MSEADLNRKSEQRALEVMERRNKAFRVLYDTVLEVEGATEEKVFSILCHNLRRISNASCAALASYCPASGTLTLEAADAEEGGCAFAGEYTGNTTKVTPDVVAVFRQSQVSECANPHACLPGLFPDLGARCLEGARRYRLSCMREGELVAVGMIQLHPGHKLRMKDMVDTYLSTAGMILQRVYAVRALRESEERVRLLNEELEQRVIERTAELRAANQELEAFAYSVAHELRSPLRSVDGFSLAILEDHGNGMDEQCRDYFDRIRRASQRMAQLIDDLLHLSRVTRCEIRRQAVDLSVLARDVAGRLQATQPERQVTFVIEDGLVANGDVGLLRVVLENLMDNAWKFTSGHSSARIELGSTRDNGDVAYFVRDDGVGFDMAYVHKLFGTFQRLHGLTEYEGNGIGLAVVQRIIQRHGGTAWAEGAVAHGATFYFTL